MNLAFLRQLKQRVEEIAADAAVRAVVVRGNERFFSAGLDLREMAGGAGGELAHLGQDDGLFALWTLLKPTIAEIAGHAVAGGALLALACDFRLTREGSQRIGMNETSFGIALPRETLEIARHALPRHTVARAVLEAETHSPAAAQALGYVHHVVPPAELGSRCLELAGKLAEYPPAGYAYNKRCLLEDAMARCHAESDAARAELTRMWLSPQTARGIAARAAAVAAKKAARAAE
jgi:enoyl-CoA hydratase